MADLGGGRGALAGGNGFGPVLKGGPAGGNLLAGRPKISGEGEMKTYIRHWKGGQLNSTNFQGPTQVKGLEKIKIWKQTNCFNSRIQQNRNSRAGMWGLAGSRSWLLHCVPAINTRRPPVLPGKRCSCEKVLIFWYQYSFVPNTVL